MSKIPPIYVINMARSTKRRKYVTEHLNHLQLDFQLVEAVDGNKLSQEKKEEVYCPQKAAKFFGTKLSSEEIGCALSHLKIYQKMIDENIEESIILEDDVEINSRFIEIIKRKKHFPANAEIIFFGHLASYPSFWHRKRIFKEYKIARVASYTYFTVGYLIKKSAAQKILSAAFPLCAPFDSYTGGHFKINMSKYGIYPACMQPLFPDNPETTMVQREELYGEARKQKWHLLRRVLYRSRFFLQQCWP